MPGLADEVRDFPRFLRDGGAMGALLRAFDWGSIGLGAPHTWPSALRSALAICLSSSFPTCVYWGAELRLFYNDAWSRIPEDRHPWCLGRPASEVWADIWPQVGPQMQRVLDTGRGFAAYDHFLPMRRHGRSEETYWTYSFTPLFDEQDRVVGVLNQGHETTSAVLAERQRESEVNRLRDMFGRAPGAVALLRGPQHVFEMANAAYLKLVGNREVLGKPVAEALPEVARQGFVQLLDQVFATGAPYKGEAVHVDLQREPGVPLEQRIVDFMYQPVRDASRRVTGIVVQATDVTERDRALQQLREADRRKDVFLATLAHELRNPLAPIRNGLQILKLATSADQRLSGTREMMERQLRHLVHLVDDLLDVSRISTGKIQLQRRVVGMRDVLALAVEATAGQFDQKSQLLDLAVGDSDVLVDGDGERLTQVFTNLLANASKFTPRGGRVVLGLRSMDGSAQVTVEDDGIGIAPESMAHVFELFGQVQAPGTHTEGLGIGLALAAQLVQMHGGRIAASSAGQDRGSCFTVTLPLAADASGRAVGAPLAAAAGGNALGKPLRIMVVDDNADAGDSMGALLRLEGHEVQVLRSGHAAVERFDQLAPDLILMDLGMPGIDGAEAARRIRELPGGRRVRIVALTGWGQETDRERTRAAGMDLHLVKPVDAEALHQLLDPMQQAIS